MGTGIRVFASLLPLGLIACSSNPTASVERGVRSDGIEVECQASGDDDVYVCTPDDGDADCESWEEGGPALVLWPPNHKLHTFSIDDCAALINACTDDGGYGDDEPTVWTIAAVTSDEPVDVGAGGDGHTPDYDVAIVDGTTVELRSERQGRGDGRVYRIELAGDDGETGVCEVHVPHDQGPTGGAVDSGEAVRVSAE